MKTRKTPSLRLAIAHLVAWLGLGVIGGPPQAVAQAPFYEGKTIRLVVGFPPGGGYDLYARALAKFLSPHVPGNPAVVVVNMPGAGSLVAANYMYNLAPKDGTEIASLETFVPFEAFYNGNGVRFDPLKFSWLGAMNAEMTTCVSWGDSKLRSFADLFETSFPFGATGSGAPPVLEPKIMNSVLGTKIRLVNGYQGTADIFVAMENRELDGTCGVNWSTLTSTREEWIKQGKLRIIAQNAVTRFPAIPDVPLLLDYAKDPGKRGLLTLLAAPNRIGRPYLAPPGIPKERLDILRAAFDATLKDPLFSAEMDRLKLAVNPVTGAETEAVFLEASRMDKSLVDQMIQARDDSK